MDKVFVSWSGGKDSCLACYWAKARGLIVSYLANTVTEDGGRSCSHGLRADMIQAQSQAMGIPVLQQRTTWNTYEMEFKKMALALKKKGVTGGVFGDIDFEPHREWVERVCGEVGVKPYLPLWGDSQHRLLREFVDLGFEAIVVATKSELLGEEWLGRKVDVDFVREIEEMGKTKAITPCGEAGEYHTLVTDGPLFRERIEILEANRMLRDGNWFLDISKWGLTGQGRLRQRNWGKD